MFENIFSFGASGSINAVNSVINLLAAFVLALIIAWVYKSTHKGLSYSQGFVNTLILAGVVISAVMMVIGSNIAAAFGAFGAFSLIRFRTAIKDSRDMGFIFLVLAVGMAIGTNNYTIAVATTAIALLIIAGLHRFNFGAIRKYEHILTFHVDSNKVAENLYKSILDKYLKRSSLLNIKALDSGQVLQLSFSASLIDENDSAQFIRDLERLDGVTEVNLITAKNDVEY